MKMARVVRKKRKLRIQGFATLFFMISVCLYLGAMFGLKSYNITLQSQSQELSAQRAQLEEAVKSAELDVKTLQNKDRITAIAEEDGITSNQGQATVLPE